MFSHLGGVLVAMAPTGMPRIVPNQFYIFKLPLEPLLQLLYLMHHWQHSKPTCILGAGRHCRFVMAVVHQNRRGGHWILQESSTFFFGIGIWDDLGHGNTHAQGRGPTPLLLAPLGLAGSQKWARWDDIGAGAVADPPACGVQLSPNKSASIDLRKNWGWWKDSYINYQVACKEI